MALQCVRPRLKTGSVPTLVRVAARIQWQLTPRELTHANIYSHFNHERHLVDRQTYKDRRSAALAEWQSLMA